MPQPVANARIAFETVFVDDRVLVVAKSRGRVTMPGRGHERDSLLNGVFSEYGGKLGRLGARRDYGLLHRLDRATSGLVALALDASTYDFLRDAFATRQVEKTYLTIARGRPPRARGTARMSLSQVRRGDLRVSIVDPRGAAAVTHWELLASSGGRSLLSVRIETGRLHQIRAHLAALGCAVEGDTVYGGANGPDTRASVSRKADRSLLLHAWRLGLPRQGKAPKLRAEAPIPKHFRAALAESGIDLESSLKALGGRGRKT